VHAGIYNRTDAELEVVKGNISRYVHSKSVADVEAILEQRGSLIISGHPGVGKTTLMRMLMCMHLEQGWQVFAVEDLPEAMEVFTSGDKRLVVFDDFLGQVSLSTDTIRSVYRSLMRFLERVQKQKDLRFILITWDYLLSQAQQESRLKSPEVNAAELVLNVVAYPWWFRSPRQLFGIPGHPRFDQSQLWEKPQRLEGDGKKDGFWAASSKVEWSPASSSWEQGTFVRRYVMHHTTVHARAAQSFALHIHP